MRTQAEDVDRLTRYAGLVSTRQEVQFEMPAKDRVLRRSSDSGEFTLSLSYDDAVFSIELFGELDLTAAPELEAVIQRAEGSKAREIVVDLSGLEFIDSSGIAVLIAAARRSRSNEGRLRFLRGTGQVEQVMSLCGLHERLPFLD